MVQVTTRAGTDTQNIHVFRVAPIHHQAIRQDGLAIRSVELRVWHKQRDACSQKAIKSRLSRVLNSRSGGAEVFGDNLERVTGLAVGERHPRRHLPGIWRSWCAGFYG